MIFSLAIMIKQAHSVHKLQEEKQSTEKTLHAYTHQNVLYRQAIEDKDKELEAKYFIDEATHIPNKNALKDKLKEDEVFTLLIVNINAFKDINDFYGEMAGDSLIQQLSSKLSQMPLLYEHHFYHLHVDKFAFLINNKVSESEMQFLISEIENYIQKQTFYASMNQNILFTLSFGISFSKDTIPQNAKLIREANLALSASKNSIKTWEIYTKQSKNTIPYEENIYWLKKLKSAIDEDRIEPYFQPIINYKTGKIFSHEALIRLIEKNGIAIAPYLFLDIAKKSKLYTTLTKIMIEKTFTKFEDSDMHFSINFSYEDMIDQEVLDLLTHKLKKGNVGKRFTAEILESESIGNYDRVKSFIETIKSYGAKAAIDDFGSGYSNFERLFKLDIDYIKIDGSIIKDIDEDKQLRIITETIVNFAKKTNIKVIAEYVHSKEIALILQNMGVKQMQGFYFSEPKPEIMHSFEKESALV